MTLYCEILDLSSQLLNLKMYPYFDIARCVLCGLSVREDLGTTAQQFSRKHPLTCWLSYIICLFTGGMVCNALLGVPILSPLRDNNVILLATVIWFFIFLTPYDIGYKIANFAPIKFIFAAMKEIYRCKSVHDGVQQVNVIYPNAYLIMVLIGTLKGNGAGVTQLLERLIRGVWPPTAIELMHSNFWTKASFAASLVFVLKTKTTYISLPPPMVYLGVSIFFVSSSCRQNLEQIFHIV